MMVVGDGPSVGDCYTTRNVPGLADWSFVL